MARRSRETTCISPRDFAWERSLIACLRHSTLPFGCELELASIADITREREQLSLLAQFAAHQAFLQFAGIADGEVRESEWRVVRKRGSDCRLVRVASRAFGEEPLSLLTLVQQFSDLIRAPELEVLRQSSGRAEAVYAEVHRRLREDVAADSRWMESAAAGSILAPGREAIEALWSERGGRFLCPDTTAIESMAKLSESITLIRLSGASPLRRYSAIESLAPLAGALDGSETEIAERVIAQLANAHYLFLVTSLETFDAASARVVDLLMTFDEAKWINAGAGSPLPDTRHLLVSSRVAAQRAVESKPLPWIESLVSSPAFAAFLDRGELPPDDLPTIALGEPRRSYLGALSLLGQRIPAATARKFLEEFLFTGSLEELVVEGITSMENGDFVLALDLSHLIPDASRAALCRVAAGVTTDRSRAVSLLLQAGDYSGATELAAGITWRSPAEAIQLLQRFPPHARTPLLADTLASALIDGGRYLEAKRVTTNDLLLAKCERRMGDYQQALDRLERAGCHGFEAALLRSDLLFVEGRYDEALAALRECEPRDDGERAQLSYQRAVLANEAGISFAGRIEDPYWLARHETYRAIRHRDVDAALASASISLQLAKSVPQRIDVYMDRVFVLFTAGRWKETRAEAMNALSLIEETEGDRAAGGILFTLAFLAADDGQWAHAAHQIERLQRFYTQAGDDQRLRELDLLRAHLDFSRGRFEFAAIEALSAIDAGVSGQMKEAAALILDEIAMIEGRDEPLRSTGRTPNLELARRHRRLLGEEPDATPFERFRTALRKRNLEEAACIATQLGVTMETRAPLASDVALLRAVATRDFPFGAHDLGTIRWRFASRNRLGHWTVSGSAPPLENESLDGILLSPPADWIVCSERELLFVEGCAAWPGESRDALGALFRLRAEHHRLHRLLAATEPAAHAGGVIAEIVGASPAMAPVYDTILRVARRDVPVCILGESGTGKELVARAVHKHSLRRQKQFTALNCAALPDTLIESELFGHVRGAFTGADRDRAGLIETTDGGTLFLDEIGEMPLSAQAKLLRFLQEGEFRRVGDVTNRHADVRVVSATNHRLDHSVEQGRFREDLYYRIRVVEILLPPLRDRGTDVMLLAKYFLEREYEKHGEGATAFTPEAESILSSYHWPGNVRELQNTIRGAHAFAGEARAIDVDHLPERLRNVTIRRTPAGSYQEAVARFRRELIERSLASADGNQNRAATLLGMSRQALAYQIRELGIMVRR